MATVAERFSFKERRPDLLSGTPRAHALDRWIFVLMAGWFIAIVLTGFIPDSIMKVGMVRAGARPPFPLVLHMHVGLLFPLFLGIAFKAREGNAGLHKRMMFLATVIPLAAGIVRITALPQTMPWSPISLQLYILLAASPMFLWDVIRNRRVHE